MLGLDDYDSDNNEDASISVKVTKHENVSQTLNKASSVNRISDKSISKDDSAGTADLVALRASEDPKIVHHLLPGPLLGPSLAPPTPPSNGSDVELSPPQSPKTRERQLVHSLTLPHSPITFIPPSPPHDPLENTMIKLENYLKLKDHGTHFNSRLVASSALRNPALLQELMDFAGIDQVVGQYLSSLSEDLAAVPVFGFPDACYGEELQRRQALDSKRRSSAVSKRVEFISAAKHDMK